MNLIMQAISFSSYKHRDQLDDDGENYFSSHVRQVVNILSNVTEDEDVICAAFLHDTLEDTDATYEEILERFGKKIADLVLEVTHEGEKDSKGYYFPRLHSKEAILIKFADRLSNLSRMDSWDEKRQAQYLKKSKFWLSE